MEVPLVAPLTGPEAPALLAPGLGSAPELPASLDAWVNTLEAQLSAREGDATAVAHFVEKARNQLSARAYERFVRHIIRRGFGARSSVLLPEPDHVRTANARKAAASALMSAFKNGWGAPEKERAAFVEWTELLASQPPTPFDSDHWHELAYDSLGTSPAHSARRAYLQPIQGVADTIRSRPAWTTSGSTSLLLGALIEIRAARDIRASNPSRFSDAAVGRLRQFDWLYKHLSAALGNVADLASALVDSDQARAVQAELENWATEPGAPAEQTTDAAKLAYRYGAIAQERAIVLRSELAPSPRPALQRKLSRLERAENIANGFNIGGWIGASVAAATAIVMSGGWIAVPAFLAVSGLAEMTRRLAARRKRLVLAAKKADEGIRASLVDDTYLETLAELDAEFPAAPVLKK
jgi:hypothetical protein